MKIYNYSPGMHTPRGAVIALGLFDGLHIGHRLLIETARRTAEEKGLTPTVFTFRTETLNKGGGALYSTEEKLDLLSDMGVEAVILADFEALMQVSAEDFVKDLLVRDMGCEVAVAGFDFRFGKGAAGNADLLISLMRESGGDAIIEEEHTLFGEKISTTRIKSLLSLGRVDQARECLGAPYFVTASVEHGRGVGKGLGFPTLNLSGNAASQLGRGVYRCAAMISGELYTAVTNVGTCPTFEERESHAEVHVIGFDGDLYGKTVRVFFLGYLREEMKFDTPESLIMQINVDINRAITENGDKLWQEIGLKLPQRET